MALTGGDFSTYLRSSDEELLERLAKVAGTICDLVNSLALAKGQQIKDEEQGFYGSSEQTVTARTRAAKFAAKTSTGVILETEGRLAALREEKSFITFILQQRQWVREMERDLVPA